MAPTRVGSQAPWTFSQVSLHACHVTLQGPPPPGVTIHQSKAIPGDLAGLSQRKTTQNDWKAFFKSKER